MRLQRILAALAIVVGAYAIIANTAFASNLHVSFTPKTGFYQWPKTGDDPLWTSDKGVKGVADPVEFAKMMSSAKAKECARLSQIPAPVWAMIVDKAKSGKYSRFSAKAGTTYRSMCFGAGDASAIPNVQWAGKAQLVGRRIVVDYMGVRFIIDIPDACANVTVNLQKAPVKLVGKTPGKPLKGKSVPPITLGGKPYVLVSKTLTINGSPVPNVPFSLREYKAGTKTIVGRGIMVSGKTVRYYYKAARDPLCEVFTKTYKAVSRVCFTINGSGQLIAFVNTAGSSGGSTGTTSTGGGGTSTTSTSSSGASSAATGGSSSSGAAGAAGSGSGGSSSSSSSSSAAAAAGPSGAAAAGAASAGASSAGGGSSSSSSSSSSASSSSSSTVVVVTTPTPAPVPNRSPSGNIVVPQHAYVTTNTSAPSTSYICVDNLFDPDGDPITVSFSVTAGTLQGSVFTQPNGARCITYLSPTTVQQVTATVTLADGRGGSFVQSNNFPIAPSQF